MKGACKRVTISPKDLKVRLILATLCLKLKEWGSLLSLLSKNAVIPYSQKKKKKKKKTKKAISINMKLFRGFERNEIPRSKRRMQSLTIWIEIGGWSTLKPSLK